MTSRKIVGCVKPDELKSERWGHDCLEGPAHFQSTYAQ